MSKIEEVAMAINKARRNWNGLEDDCDDLVSGARDSTMDEARAAVAAMRGPTPAMLEAEVHDWNAAQTDRPKITLAGEACWNAMIDAALNEKH